MALIQHFIIEKRAFGLGIFAQFTMGVPSAAAPDLSELNESFQIDPLT
jgi:hypothetical protein